MASFILNQLNKIYRSRMPTVHILRHWGSPLNYNLWFIWSMNYAGDMHVYFMLVWSNYFRKSWGLWCSSVIFLRYFKVATHETLFFPWYHEMKVLAEEPHTHKVMLEIILLISSFFMNVLTQCPKNSISACCNLEFYIKNREIDHVGVLAGSPAYSEKSKKFKLNNVVAI